MATKTVSLSPPRSVLILLPPHGPIFSVRLPVLVISVVIHLPPPAFLLTFPNFPAIRNLPKKNIYTTTTVQRLLPAGTEPIPGFPSKTIRSSYQSVVAVAVGLRRLLLITILFIQIPCRKRSSVTAIPLFGKKRMVRVVVISVNQFSVAIFVTTPKTMFTPNQTAPKNAALDTGLPPAIASVGARRDAPVSKPVFNSAIPF